MMVKRILLILFFTPLAFLLLGPAEALLSRVLRTESPIAHEIRPGEYLSQVAKEYYGEASYWRELALLNRAPNPDYVLPGERLLVPSFSSIKRIRRARTLSEVNRALLDVQARMTGGLRTVSHSMVSTSSPGRISAQRSAGTAIPKRVQRQHLKVAPVQAAGGGWLWAIFVPAVAILVVGGAVIWRRRRRNTFPDLPEFRAGKSEASHRDLDLEPLSDRTSGSDFEGEKVQSEKDAEALL